MKTSLIPSHRAKTRALAELCKSAADLEDSRIQAYLAKSLAIMVSAYVEICVRETISEFCKTKGHPAVVAFIVKTVEKETSAIDSLKNLRDQAAHGKDNNTGYVVVTRYFKAVEDSRKNLEQH